MEHVAFLGTYTNSGASKGIYRIAYDSKTLAPSGPVALAAPCGNPTFLACDEGRRLLFATGDAAVDGSARPQGVVRCFRIPSDLSADLKLLRELPLGSLAGAPTHVVYAGGASALLLVHYSQGRVFSIRLASDGLPFSLVSTIAHEGRLGPDAKRQDKPHPHSFTLAPDERFAFSPDLGLDRVFRYALEKSTGRLIPEEPKSFAVAPGAGPRHAKFSRDGRHLYVVEEMGGCVDVFAYEAGAGTLTHVQTLSSLPPGFSGENTSAELQIHPNDAYVYVSNRGPDTLAVFRRDSLSGRLTKIQDIASGGAHPRHFALSPDGNSLLCANRDSNNLTLFAVDSGSGLLTQVGPSISAPSPICVVFAR